MKKLRTGGMTYLSPMLGYNSTRFWTEATYPHRLRSHCVYWVPSARISATPLGPLSPGSAHLAMALPLTPTSILLVHAVKEKQHISWGGKTGSRLQAGTRAELSGRISICPAWTKPWSNTKNIMGGGGGKELRQQLTIY